MVNVDFSPTRSPTNFPDPGGVDVGPIGVPAQVPTSLDEAFDPTFRVCSPAVYIELLAEDGTVIKEPGVKGNVVATPLVRYLQPMIRYPVGDVAEWVDYAAKTFKHRGRTSIAIKLATTFLDLPLIKKTIAEVVGASITGRFQCIVRRSDGSSVLVFRLAIPKPTNYVELRDEVENALARASPKWKRDRECDAIAPLILEWVTHNELIFSEKSGKLREIVDERY
jgi:phenylacetate-CoA ligase